MSAIQQAQIGYGAGLSDLGRTDHEHHLGWLERGPQPGVDLLPGGRHVQVAVAVVIPVASASSCAGRSES